MSLISMHPAPYQVDRARAEKDYARHFTKGWWSLDIRRFDLFQKVLTTKVWSPIIFAEGHRLGANFKEARWLALDFDTPEYDLAQCKQDWCDTVHIIGTTKNHQKQKGGHPPCDRFRLVVPFVSVIRCPRTYEHNFRVVGERYGADTQVKDRARLFFPCQEIVSVVTEGEMQPILEAPSEAPTPIYTTPGRVPGYAKWMLNTVIEKERTLACNRCAKDLIRFGATNEEVYAAIISSKTYRTYPPDAYTIGKIRQAITSARTAIEREFSERRQRDPNRER